jgi:DNA-binding MarR family transcriptional regulator
MAAQRLSRLQKRILRWLVADYQRIRGGVSSGHQALAKAIPVDKGALCRSLRTLEKRGWLIVGRTPGGKATYLYLNSCSRGSDQIGMNFKWA